MWDHIHVEQNINDVIDDIIIKRFIVCKFVAHYDDEN